MDYFVKAVRSLERGGVVIAGACILLNMTIVVLSVFFRAWGGVLMGTYELVEITIGMAVVFALGHAAMEKANIVVDLFKAKFSPRTQVIFESFNSIITMAFWAVIAWASIGVVRDKLILGEVTEQLHLPFIPFRVIWIIGVMLCCLIIMTHLYKTLFPEVDTNESN